MRVLLFFVATALMAAGCPAALAASDKSAGPAAIRIGKSEDIAAIERIEHRSMNAKSGEDMRPLLAKKGTFIWDVVDKPWYGVDGVVEHIQQVLSTPQFDNFKPKLVYMEIEAGDTVGFVNAIQNLVLMDKSGKVVFDLDYRVTNTYRKENGKWLMVGEHLSFPVDLVTGKAVFGRLELPPGAKRLGGE